MKRSLLSKACGVQALVTVLGMVSLTGLSGCAPSGNSAGSRSPASVSQVDPKQAVALASQVAGSSVAVVGSVRSAEAVPCSNPDGDQLICTKVVMDVNESLKSGSAPQSVGFVIEGGKLPGGNRLRVSDMPEITAPGSSFAVVLKDSGVASNSGLQMVNRAGPRYQLASRSGIVELDAEGKRLALIKNALKHVK